MNNFKHVPVLTSEVIDLLFPDKVIDQPIIIDCTVGLGGHAKLILEKLNNHGFLFGFDIDEKATEIAKENLKDLPFDNFKLVCKSFTEIKSYLTGQGILEIDKAIFDLGLSSMQIDDLERGFSYCQDCLLDMRMDKSSNKKDAKYILNGYSESKLLKLFQKYGLGKFSKGLIKNIVYFRKNEEIKYSSQLNEIVKKTIFGSDFQIKKYQKLLFQALRLEVNQELETFEKGLKIIWELLKKNGILLVITFHSLEEKVLKKFFEKFKLDPRTYKIPVNDLKLEKFTLITKKPIKPSLEEMTKNKRSSPAKLWAFKKLN